ncbi:MAG: hypothetical protein PVG03_12510, partial [Desulfarculaceae bacterium]
MSDARLGKLSSADWSTDLGHEPMISNRRLLLIRFWHNRMLLAGSVVVLVFLVMAIFAPYLTGYDPNKRDIRHRFASPSIEHFMGTDQL